jgi:predicted aspartyl protease
MSNGAQEGMTMGEMYLDLTIANITDMTRQEEVSFFIDTGATRSWIPQEIAERLDIRPLGRLSLELADSSIKDFPYGPCFFEFGGEIVAGNVVIGPPNSEPLAGTHVLQDFRLVIDLSTHTISRSRAMKAK